MCVMTGERDKRNRYDLPGWREPVPGPFHARFNRDLSTPLHNGEGSVLVVVVVVGCPFRGTGEIDTTKSRVQSSNRNHSTGSRDLERTVPGWMSVTVLLSRPVPERVMAFDDKLLFNNFKEW